MKTIITIEARMGSSRLPGKVLRPILGRPMLELMIERLQRARLADGVVVATTDQPADDAIAALATAVGVGCHRGSETDVLGRVLDAARLAGAELIVETTADCPLIDPAVIDQMVATFRTNPVDYCSNVLTPTYPRGLDVQVFPTRVLAEVARLTNEPADREHVSLYIYEHPERYRLLNVASGLPAAVRDLRLTVDTPLDLELVAEVFARLYPVDPCFALADIWALMEREPRLRTLNQSVQQKTVR